MKSFKILFLSFIALNSCKSTSEENKEMKTISSASAVQVQGHRGDRGNFPENSLPAFKSAVKKGVDVLELDVVVSRDHKIVVSHEPYMSSLYASTPAGDSISQAGERSYNMYEMNYDSIRQYDVGSRGNPRFPEQEKMKTYKPLLSEVLASKEAFIAEEDLQPVKYNIELKSVEAEYGIYQPQPQEFVDLVMEIIREKEIGDRINIQSFDPAILNVVHREYPETELAYLVSGEGIEENLSLLEFKPEIYSPNFRLVKDSAFVESIKSMEMELIPWTVNEREDIRKMMRLGVDAIITDYPEKVLEIKKSRS